MSNKLSRKGDATAAQGKILKGSSTVFANNKAVGVHKSDITPHPGGGPHNKSKTTEGSPTVFADGLPVLRVGSGTTCGHKIVEGSDDIQVD